MPYYRRGYRRKFKRGYGRKSRKGWWKRKQKKYSGQTGVRMFKFKNRQAVSSDASGVISVYFNNNPTTYTEWAACAGLFDSYRMAALKITFIPDKIADTSTTTNYRPLYVFGDLDAGTMPVTNVDAALQYENCKFKNTFRPWTYYFKIPKATAATGNIFQGGWLDAQAPPTTSGIGVFGDGFDLSDNYGVFVVTAYFMFKNRQ